MNEAVDFLYEIPKFTKKNSLDHTRRLMTLLGSPCLETKVIHVAGSNGKGSVCCFLANMLQAGGKRVGLFTSPHLVDIRERFVIDGEPVDEEGFLSAFDEVRAAVEVLMAQGLPHPTFFEWIFAMGMVIFAQKEVEVVVLETGLGGRLDATNSFPTPVLTVITSISLEHTQYLGSTLSAIAGEKAGIIKEGVPLVYWGEEEEVARVLAETAEAKHSPAYGLTKKNLNFLGFTQKGLAFSLSTAYDKTTTWRINSFAGYQMENAALAITAMRVLADAQAGEGELPGTVDLPRGAIQGLRGSSDFAAEACFAQVLQQGLDAALWPGRMQQVLPEVYLDGAHNPAGIAAFLESVKALSGADACPPLLLFSMVKDKDVVACVEELCRGIAWEAIMVTAIPGERGSDETWLQALFSGDGAGGVEACPDLAEAFSRIYRRKVRGQKLFCTGSLYFVGELLCQLKENTDDRF